MWFLPQTYDSAQITFSLWARAFLPCSLGTSLNHCQPWHEAWLQLCHLGLVSRAAGAAARSGALWWNRKGFSKRKAEPKKRKSFHLQADFECPASLCGTVSNFLPSQLLLTHGWMASSLLSAHCSMSVCLSKVQSQPHLAINKYVSTLSASPIIIISPELEGWHSHWASRGPDPARCSALFISTGSKQKWRPGFSYPRGDFLFSLKY